MKCFIPDMYKENIYKIDYVKLKKRGIKCLLFDLDNTLVSYQEKEPNKKLKEFITFLGEDFKVMILSNGVKERVRPFKEKLNIDASHSSKKPLKRKYKKILSMYDFKANEIACIGDQVMTDVLGANSVGMISILINRVGVDEPVWTKSNRVFERIVLKKLNKKGILVKGSYYD